MENRDVFDLLKQYSKQSETSNSLANGEVEARDLVDLCDCCSSGCLCTAACVDCFT